MRPWTIATAALAALVTGCALSPALAAIAGALTAAPEAIAAGQWWRLVTGPLVHGTAGHLAVDVGVLLAIGLAYERTLGGVYPWLLLVGLVVPTAAVLTVEPTLTGYYGISGLTHALVAAAIAVELRGPARRWAMAAALALAGKVALELTAGPMMPLSLTDGARQVPVAHLAGALVGALVVQAAALADSAAQRRPL